MVDDGFLAKMTNGISSALVWLVLFSFLFSAFFPLFDTFEYFRPPQVLNQKPFYWFLCWTYLCFVSEFLELNTLLQRPQRIEIPAIWFASMWCIMFVRLPSFPHTLHIRALPLFVLYGSAFSLNVIIDSTCWFKLSMSVLLVVWSIRTSAFSLVDCTILFSLKTSLFARSCSVAVAGP